jgi:hypothetical protein
VLPQLVCLAGKKPGNQTAFPMAGWFQQYEGNCAVKTDRVRELPDPNLYRQHLCSEKNYIEGSFPKGYCVLTPVMKSLLVPFSSYSRR